jgi:hypothetical protein
MVRFSFLLIILVAGYLLPVGNVYSGGAGTTGAVILELAYSGARPLGMGEAFTSVANDVNALQFNPAGLINVKKTELGIMYLPGLGDTSYGFTGLICPLDTKSRKVVGAGLAVLEGGMITINNSDGITPPKEMTALQDYLVTLGYAMRFGEESVGIGANVKFLQSTIMDYTTMAYCADIGGLWSRDSLKVGISIQNIGSGIRYDRVTDPLPLSYRLGSSYNLILYRSPREMNALISADMVKAGDAEFQPNAGVECRLLNNLLSIRTGYLNKNITLGGGINLSSFQLDYGYSLMGDLTNVYVHRVSFITRF